MANIRKPINDPLGGSAPTPKLPPLPVQASGTMGASSDQVTQNTPVEPQVAPVEANRSVPRLAPLSPFPPLPGRITPNPLPSNQEVFTPRQETSEQGNLVSEDLYETDPDEEDEDDDFMDEEEELLSEDDEELLRRIYFSGDPELASQTIYALLDNEDVDWQILESLASNPATPEEFLLQLSHNENDFVRQAVMENEAISDVLFSAFINDPEIMIVAALIENPRTTPEIVRALINHPEDYIRILVKRSPLLTDAEKNQVRV